MAKTNRTRTAVLGFLTWHPMSGYDIKKRIEESIRNFWSESPGQIYPILRRLADDGLATKSTGASDGGRDRHLYTITEQGREELRRWLEASVDLAIPRNELLLKLFFGRQVDRETCIWQVREYRKQMSELLDKYEATEQRLRRDLAEHPDLQYWLITLRFGVSERTAAIDWADQTLAELERGDK